MEAIIFTKTSWPIISDEKYSMVDRAWKLAIEALDGQRAVAGAPGGTGSVCQCLGGPFRKIKQQTQAAVSVYLVFCSLIRHIVLLNPKKYT